MDEDFRPRTFLSEYREPKFIENLLATIRMQQDEIERLEDEVRKLKCLD